jgi:hypothetical protein
MLIKRRDPQSMAEAAFLNTDLGRRAYLRGGPARYGADEDFKSAFKAWHDHQVKIGRGYY